MARRRRRAPDTLPRPWHWTDDAACRNEDPRRFFPDLSTVAGVLDAIYAKSVCGHCPVRLPCLTHALARREFGIWGGLDEDERTEIQQARRRQADRQRRRAQREAGTDVPAA